MKKIIPVLLSFCFCLNLIGALPQEQATKDRMKSDLDILRNAFDVNYAPKEWKFNYAQWDLDKEINKAKDKLQATSPITVKAYQRIVKDFFRSTKDYHVGVYFYSTEKATLPFRIKGVNGKYFVTSIDSTKLDAKVFPLNLGDEIVSFNGRAITEELQEIFDDTSLSNDNTDRQFAAYFLTLRPGMLGFNVPRGPVMIGVKRSGNDKIAYQQLMWDYTPEKVTNGLKGAPKDYCPVEESHDIRQNRLFQRQMISPMVEVLQTAGIKMSDGKDMIGSRESYIPPLGRIWWTSASTSPFHAYLYETEDRKLIGYIRIPHYMGWDGDVKEFEEIISYFQERSDALVIDQINNPGGNPLYCYALLSTLTDTPLATPKHRFTITQEDVYYAHQFISRLEKITTDEQAVDFFGGETFFGLPVSHQMVQFYLDYLQFVVSEWKEGRHLTQPHFLYSVDHVNPHPNVRYTKPILFLINELDISCGDFAPAILQDNQKVTLMGTRTAGAGGYVLPDRFSNRYGIAMYSCTGSIAERLDKNPIENLGVTPEIHYTLTEDDLRYGFLDYANAINAAVKNLLNPPAKEEKPAAVIAEEKSETMIEIKDNK